MPTPTSSDIHLGLAVRYTEEACDHWNIPVEVRDIGRVERFSPSGFNVQIAWPSQLGNAPLRFLEPVYGPVLAEL